MASRSLGVLSLDLVARIGQFSAGMTQAERQTEKTAKKIKAEQERMRLDMEKTWSAVGTSLGVGLAGAATAAFAAFKTNVNSLDAFNDLADITGSSIENLSALDRVARESGASFEVVQSSLLKFNQGLSSMEEDGDGASEVIRNLGLSVKELKGLDPAEALRRVAVAFSEYGDTASKARNVQALFGKSVAEVGPFLKDLSDQQSLVGTTTSEAARQSEVFNKNLAGMRANAVDLGRSITADALPAINLFLQNLRDIQKMGGLGTVLGDAAKDVFGFGKLSGDPGADIKKLMRERDRLLKDRDFATNKDRPTRGLDADLKEIEKLLEVSRARQANGVLASAEEFSDQISRRLQHGTPELADVTKPKPSSGGADDPTKTLLGNELKTFERSIQEQMGIVADRNRHLERLNAQGLISIKDFYGQQRDILNAATSEQMAAYDAQIAALEKYRDASTKKTEKADADGKIADLMAKRTKLAQEQGMATLEINEKETKATKDLGDAVQDLTTRMMELNGQTVEVAKINFDKANEGLRQLLQTNGDTAGLANLDRLREVAIAQAQINEATKNFQLIQSELSDVERRIAMDREAGSISEMEALTRTGEARRERLKLMQAEIDKILAIKAVSELSDEQKENLRRLTGQVEEAKRSADPLGDKFRSSFENASGTMFNDIISGSKRAGDAIKDFSGTLLTEFNSIISKELGKELMNSLFGQKGASAGTSGGGWGALVTGFMSMFGFSEGGYTGNGGKHAPAGVVHKGEVVWSQSDISRAGGVGVVEAMRLGRRGYSSGGVVGMPADAGGRGGGVEINIHAPPGSQTEQRSRRDSGGKEIIDVFIKQAVDTVAGQIATNSGPVGQALRSRHGLGM